MACRLCLIFGFFGSCFIALGEHAVLGSHRATFLAATDKNAFRDSVHQAVAEALSSRNSFNRGHLEEVRKSVVPIWRALAKNQHGRIDRRTLRYMVHRYLLRERSVSIIGLEPLQHKESMVEGSLLTMHAPEYLQSVLNESDQVDGFSLDDAVAMVAMLEELVMRAGHQRLDAMLAEKKWRKPVDSEKFLQTILQTYLVRWIMGNDTESIRILETNRNALRETFEDWDGMVGLVRGRISQFKRTRSLQVWKNQGTSTDRDLWHPLRREFSYRDVELLTGDIVLTFGRYWHAECERVKSSLLKMDYTNTGRVKLADFHHAASQGEWRFSESREYLRSLGSLDETSSALGPRVILQNYLQSASNCIVGDDHYRVCCANDCESVMIEIEDSVRAPTASAKQLLEVVEKIIFNLDDDQLTISAVLRKQIAEIADANGGKVPIHGRLFAQWLHYVFPRDCPFPHKGGTVFSLAPHEFGSGFMVTNAELDLVARKHERSEKDNVTAQDWMTQWSEEEELVSSSLDLQPPWEVRALKFGARALCMCVLLFAIAVVSVIGGRGLAFGTSAGKHQREKEHFV